MDKDDDDSFAINWTFKKNFTFLHIAKQCLSGVPIHFTTIDFQYY